MQRLALLPLLAYLLIASNLVSCGPAPGQPAVLVPSATASEPAIQASRASATHTQAPAPGPKDTLSPILRSAPTPTCTPTPTPTLPPTLTPIPPPSTPVAGDSLSLSLGWQFGSGGHLSDGVVAHRGDQSTFIVSSLDRRVYALDSNGQVRWQAQTSGPAYVVAALDEKRVVVGDDAGQVTILDERGRRLWQHKLGSRVTALHSGWQGGLLASGWDERLTFLTIEAGEEQVRWQAELGSAATGITSLEDLALVATLSGEVIAVSSMGTEVARFDSGAPVTRLGLVEGTEGVRILVGVQDGRLLALGVDASGFRLHWQQMLGLGGPVWHVVDLVGDSAPEIIAGTGGTEPVLALLSAAGDVLWRLVMPSPVGATATLDLDGDGALEILAGLASGEIQAYDGQGQLRGSIHAGLPVWDLEVAEDGHAWALADVVAWQIAGAPGPTGGPWLPPPAMVPALPESSPPAVGQAAASVDTDQGATFVFLGDVTLGRSIEAQLERYGAAYPWEGLGPLLHAADLAVANLEGVLTTKGQPLDKEYLIRAHPRWGQTLVEGGLDLVTVANNHALDFGQVGLDETLTTLQALEITAVGASSLRDQQQSRRPAIFSLNGVRVAVLGYAAARWNGSMDVPATERLAWANIDAVQADVRTAREKVDLVIVLLHAGTEYAAKPSPDQVAVSHAAVDAGADLVVGHHPHVTQTVERYRRGLIVYSLGDALFDIPRPGAMQGDLLHVHATQEGLVQAELWPFWIEDAIRPRLLTDDRGAPQFKIIYP